MPLLKLAKHDPQKELEFNVRCALALPQDINIHKMLQLAETLLRLAKKYASQKPYQIIKRPLR